MEEAYRASLFKSFAKTLEDGFFPVVIVDAIHDKVRCMICCIYLYFIAPLVVFAKLSSERRILKLSRKKQ